MARMADREPNEENLHEQFSDFQRQVEEDLYTAIGKAISMWSRNEGALVVIATALLGIDAEKTGLIFYSILNFHAWLSIINELFAQDSQYLPLRPKWIAIENRLKKLNDMRVQLAHHTLRGGLEVPDAATLVAGKEEDLLASLRPNKFDTRTKSKKYLPLQMSQLAIFGQEISEVTGALAVLMEEMVPIAIAARRKEAERVLGLTPNPPDEQADPGTGGADY
jgi:hypothetical protein